MAWLFLLGTILLAGCDNNDSVTDNGPDQDPAAQPDSTPAPAAPGKLVGVRHTLDRTPEHCDGNGCARVSIEWLTFEGQPALNQAIENRLATLLIQQEGQAPHDGTLEGLAEAFLTDAGNLAMGDQGWRLSANVSKSSRRGDLLTLRIESHEYTGGAHGSPTLLFFHWDLARQQQLALDDLLVPGQQQAFWALAQDAHRQWLDTQQLDRNFRDSWPFERTAQGYFDKQGLVLVYNVYQIAPYAMGQPALTVPYGKLEGVVRAQYLP